MKNIFWFWNLMHYNLYRCLVIAHNLFNYINPFSWFHKIHVVKKFYARHGVEDMNKFTDRVVFNDPKIGVSSIWAGIHIGGLLVLLEYSTFNFVQGFLMKPLIKYIWEDSLLRILFIALLLFPPALFNYLVLFRKDKYLEYFKEFEKISSEKKRKYGWISFLFVLSVLLFTIVSFMFVMWKMNTNL